MKMNEEKKAMLAATLAYTIFGLSYLFSKMALNITAPTILLWVRFTITFICLNILLLTRFGSLKAIKAAAFEDLLSTPGMNKAAAEAVIAWAQSSKNNTQFM